ncbi:Holliday junction resolvase [Candidatus Woesearchaeota archaeon]|nr:Holliday junction resolvase [Candidatus Woesearchaeota archaeon]
MSSKSKGTKAERELLHLFWAKEWATIRSAGSGSMKYPGPDLIASNKARVLAIECKSTKKNKQYLEEYDIKQLKDFCDIFGAEPWFAVRFSRKDWLFLSIEDIEKTETGYVIDSKVAERRGLLIDELIKT